MTGNRKKKPVFTSGITYEEHRKRAKAICDEIVRPQVKRYEETIDEPVELSEAQKAHLSCDNLL